MEFKEAINFLNLTNSRWSSWSSEKITLPFEVLPSEYLSFAEYDIKSGKEKHKLINALSNAKRSLDCQIDSLLIALGLYELAKKKNWNIPKKINVLKAIGILAPRILNKINSYRNLVEHEFVVPNEEQVTDFIDVVALFNASTNTYLNSFPGDSQIENETNKDIFLDIEFNREENNVKVQIIRNGVGKEKKFLIDTSHEYYLEFISSYIKKFKRN